MVQLSEPVFQTISKHPANPFTFDKPHTAVAKGFGTVTAYFIKSTTDRPPKPVLIALSLEPAFGRYHFDLSESKAAGNPSHPPARLPSHILGPSSTASGPSASLPGTTEVPAVATTTPMAEDPAPQQGPFYTMTEM